jgi:hypothetical protein
LLCWKNQTLQTSDRDSEEGRKKMCALDPPSDWGLDNITRPMYDACCCR